MQKDNLPFYYKNWFLIILFLIGPATFFITSIAAIVLMLSRDEALLTVTKEEHAKYQEILAQQHEADSIVINAKSDAKQIINDAKKDAENIITEANNKKEKINDEVLTLEKEKERFYQNMQTRFYLKKLQLILLIISLLTKLKMSCR